MADVRAALDEALHEGEVGIQVAAYLGEELIVDECAGTANAAGDPVTPDSLFPVFSVSKAVIATAVHLEAERGTIDLDRPIATYWPSYTSHGKDRITIRDVLTHRAGVSQMPPAITPERLGDWDWIVAGLEEVVPFHPPGERTLYHALSFGYLLGEVIRRVDAKGRDVGTYVREELCSPLGIDDLWLGLPPEQERRVVELTWGQASAPAPQIPPGPLRLAAMPPAVSPVPEIFNRPEVHAACSPSAGGIMTAKAGARFFSLLANRGQIGSTRLLSEERLLALTTPRPNPMEPDESTGLVPWLGTGGYWIGGPVPPADPLMGAGRLLGHPGAGGSIGWADLDSGLAVVIAHNRVMGADALARNPLLRVAAAVRAATA